MATIDIPRELKLLWDRYPQYEFIAKLKKQNVDIDLVDKIMEDYHSQSEQFKNLRATLERHLIKQEPKFEQMWIVCNRCWYIMCDEKDREFLENY